MRSYSRLDQRYPTTEIPAHQATASTPLLPMEVPSRRPRTVSMTGVNGWFSANQPKRPAGASVDPQEAVAFIEGIKGAWVLATPEERARLVQATYRRITVNGPNVVRVKLTPMAERTGLPALLPENVHDEWAVARPTGLGRAGAIEWVVLRIVGADEWRRVAAARMSA